MTPTWQLAAELGDTLRSERDRTSTKTKCGLCGRMTTALSGICDRHEDGGVTGELYKRLRAACCDISGLTAGELDEHAAHVVGVVVRAKARKNGAVV